MLVLAILIAFSKGGNFFNRLSWAVFIFPVGFSGLWGFITLAFYTETVSDYMGWPRSSPFEFQAALTCLLIGIMGIISPFSSNGYKKATATLVSIYLLGTAINRIHQIIVLHNMNPGNAGSMPWTDIIIPIVLWIAIVFSKEKQSNQINWTDH